MISCAV